MIIQHNIPALNAYRYYNKNVSSLSKNLEKLSSGYRINSAGDDAAGLAISEKMRAQITGLDAAQKNVKDGTNLIKTAEGALQEVQDMMNRMVYLATQSANGTYDNEVDRMNLQKEVDALKDEIDRIADSANFNGQKLLDGSLAAAGENSAVTSITTEAYTAAGTNDTFTAEYVTNRPPAATSATAAVFEVSLDDLAISAGTAAGTKHTVNLNVGGTVLTYTSADNSAQTAQNIRDGLLKAGKLGTDGDSTGKIEADELSAGDGSANAKYVEIDGHVYEMSTGTGTNAIKFTQVNDTGTTGVIVNPDYEVSVNMTAAMRHHLRPDQPAPLRPLAAAPAHHPHLRHHGRGKRLSPL